MCVYVCVRVESGSDYLGHPGFIKYPILTQILHWITCVDGNNTKLRMIFKIVAKCFSIHFTKETLKLLMLLHAL